MSRGTRNDEWKKASLYLESSSQRHLSLQMTAIALENIHAHLQLEAHQKEKLHLHPVYFFAAHASHSRVI